MFIKEVKNTYGGVILFKRCRLLPATLLIKVSLPYGCFSHYFNFIIDNVKQTCLFFKLHGLFRIAQSIGCQIIDLNNVHWKYQWWSLSFFQVRFCFLQRNYAHETKISIYFIDICSRPFHANEVVLMFLSTLNRFHTFFYQKFYCWT